MTKRASSNRTGTLPCVRATSDAWGLPPAAALEAAVPLEARLPLPVLLQVPVRQPRPARLLLRVLLQLLVRLAREAEVPAVEELVLHRSFSAATVERITSVGIPQYAPVPRSRRKPNSRP